MGDKNREAEDAAQPHGQILVYRAEDRRLKIDVRLEGETAWLTQAHLAELFQTTVPNISMHTVKGFVLDDERLKNPDQPFDYFEELLRRIQRNST